MKHYLILLYLVMGIASCGKKSKLSDFIENPDDRNPYTISANHVGPIQRGTNINKLYSLYPKKQIKLIKNTAGSADCR